VEAYRVEILRLPHILNNQFMHDSEVVNLKHLMPFTPKKIAGTIFLLEAELTPGPQYGWKD
jgi:hypothetical protein